MLAALVCFTGCLTFETLITVRDDGSGTIEMVFALSGPMLDMITSLAGNESLCDEENLQEEASKMGEGVRLSSAEPIDEDGRKGCRAFYDFDDINQLTINQNPGDQMPSGMASDEPTAPEDVVTFSFTPGSPATLVVNLPQDFQDNTPDEDPTPVDSTPNRDDHVFFCSCSFPASPRPLRDPGDRRPGLLHRLSYLRDAHYRPR